MTKCIVGYAKQPVTLVKRHLTLVLRIRILHNSLVYFISQSGFSMFNLKNLFTKSKALPLEVSSALEKALQSYRSVAFPVGLLDVCQYQLSDVTDDKITLHLVMPFAASSEKNAIEAHLSDQLGLIVVVDVAVVLPTTARFKAIKHIILVASGKGGVGKSTTAVNLARALTIEGAQVGVLDADIYGPSIPMLFGLNEGDASAKDDKTLLAHDADGILVQSIGFLVNPDEATVWRGPMASTALMQLLNETDWGELDYLIVDMPPGTGDIQLTMAQKVPASGAVIVTTPQDLALQDAQKGIAMFNHVKVPLLGLIENMSFFNCVHCGGENHVFGCEGGVKLAQRHGVSLLAEVPLSLELRELSEQGKQISQATDNQVSKIYNQAARLLASQLYYQHQTRAQVEIVVTED
jgi:ATP-binding protein involved in chromosome partitioning